MESIHSIKKLINNIKVHWCLAHEILSVRNLFQIIHFVHNLSNNNFLFLNDLKEYTTDTRSR